MRRIYKKKNKNVCVGQGEKIRREGIQWQRQRDRRTGNIRGDEG